MKEGKDRGKLRIVNSYLMEMGVRFCRDKVGAWKRPRLREDMSVCKKKKKKKKIGFDSG